MFRSTGFRAFGVLCTLTLLAAPAAANFPAKRVAGFYKRAVNQELRSHRVALEEIRRSFCNELDNLEATIDSLTSGGSPLSDAGGIVASLADSLGVAYSDAYEVTAGTAQGIGNAAVDELSKLFEDEPIPSGFLSGDCETTDDAQARLAAELERFNQRIQRKVKRFMRKARRKGLAMTAIAEAPEPPAVVAEMPPPEDPIKPTEVQWSAGAELTSGASDGHVCFGGSYDPRNGADIEVTIAGPSGDITRMADLDEEGCRWSVCFGPSEEDPALPPGNYRPEVDQLKGDQAFTSHSNVAGSVPQP